MTDIQKHPKLATKEQLRLAELLVQPGSQKLGTTDDAASQKRLKKVVELTNCTPSVAEVALIDTEGSVEAAVALLLDKPDELVLWSHKGAKVRNKPVKPTPVATNSGTKQSRGRSVANNRNDDWKNGPRVFMPSNLQPASTTNNSIVNSSSTAPTQSNNTSGWIDQNKNKLSIVKTQNTTTFDYEQPALPKTFASVAASKKVQPPPPQPPPVMAMNQFPKMNLSSDATGESSRVKQQRHSHQSDEQQHQPSVTDSALLDVKSSSAICEAENTPVVEQEWSTTVDWGVPISPRLNNCQPAVVSNSNQLPHSESISTTMAPADSFGASAAHSISVNQDYTNQLKSAIGLMQQPQQTVHQQHQSPQNNQHLTSQNNSNIAKRMSTASSVEYFQQQMSQMHDTFATDAFDKKVEFATGDLPPAVANLASSYQFGFQFDAKNGIPSAASLNDAWSTKHISSVEMDRSMLKNSTAANVLSTMTSIPTTSSNVTAHFSTSIHAASQHPSNDYRSQQQQQQRNISQAGNGGSAALSFTDTASVNYPPANNSTSGISLANTASAVNHPPSASIVTSTTSGASQAMQQQSQQQQIIKTTTAYYTASSQPQQQQQQIHPSMMAAAAAAAAATVSIQQQQPTAASHHMPPPLTHHLQQHQPPPQTIYHHHQTSTAPPPTANAVAQYPSYNMPYMYSPVAAAQTLPGASAEIDRYLLQQYAPYRGLDMQIGAMTLGPPTSLAPAPSHRNQMDSFMDNKFGPQQQNVNQQGQLSHNPVTAAQQQRAGQPVQGDAAAAAAAMFGGGHVAPPPGFGMPTPPAQASYMPQPANLQSLFQMPTYHPQMSYQHQFMMPSANCLPQRPTAQTSPPEGNGGGPRDVQNFGTGESEQHSGAGGGHPSYVNKYVNNNTYRPYM